MDNVQLVFDHPTGRSRGFGFVYFKKIEDAIEAKERVAGTEIDGHKIRIDYSITKRPHTPTPGIYMGAVDSRRRGPLRSYRRSPSPCRSYRRYRDSSPSRYYSRLIDEFQIIRVSSAVIFLFRLGIKVIGLQKLINLRHFFFAEDMIMTIMIVIRHHIAIAIDVVHLLVTTTIVIESVLDLTIVTGTIIDYFS